MFMRHNPGWRALIAIACLLMLCAAWPARANSNLLVWPIDPVIEHDERATALWIENRGREPVHLQVRVFAWNQPDGENAYATQSQVVSSPPMFQVAAGQRQLIRLTRTGEQAVGVQHAYRVILDEIPRPRTAEGDGSAPPTLQFQMRYSIPLFLYGKGLWNKERPDRKRDPATAAQPALRWHAELRDGRPFLVVHNAGPIHARLTDVRLDSPTKSLKVSEGMLGYVLPGSVMRWPLAEGAYTQGQLTAKVNGSREPITIERRSSAP